MLKIKKAVIPVAGMGTRFLPVTKAIPKEMLPIIDKPTIQYIVEECANSGIEEILFITSPYKKSIEDHFDQSFELEKRLENSQKNEQLKMIQDISKLVKIFYIRQGQPLGSGHAIKLAKDFINNEPFAVLYGDDIIKSKTPALKQLIKVYEQYDCNVIGVQEVDHNLVNKYGIIEFLNDTNKIKRIIEKPTIDEAPSNIAGLGRYIVKPEIFNELDNLTKGINNEYQFTDAMLKLMLYQPFYACKFEGTYFDIGNQLGYLKANVAYAIERDFKDELITYIKEII
ncbi:MAG: UTP--glucose-1-phosphate uridylyltransferase GalU [Bacilli bacterium]